MDRIPSSPALNDVTPPGEEDSPIIISDTENHTSISGEEDVIGSEAFSLWRDGITNILVNPVWDDSKVVISGSSAKDCSIIMHSMIRHLVNSSPADRWAPPPEAGRENKCPSGIVAFLHVDFRNSFWM